jgi:hypothetical protein
MTGLHNEPGIYHFVALLLLIYLSLDWFGLVWFASGKT